MLPGILLFIPEHSVRFSRSGRQLLKQRVSKEVSMKWLQCPTPETKSDLSSAKGNGMVYSQNCMKRLLTPPVTLSGRRIR